jgi:hypothetical protein
VTLGRSGASCAGAISRRAPRSRVVANTAARWIPKRRKAPRSFGNRRSSRGGGGRGPLAVSLRRGGVSSPPDAKTRRPGCSRERMRRGRSSVKRRVLRSAPSARAGHVAKVTRLARLALTVVPTRASGKARWATWVRRLAQAGERRPRPLVIHGRGSSARRVCPRVVSCCRSRQASPGPEKREQGPLLTERPIHVGGV